MLAHENAYQLPELASLCRRAGLLYTLNVQCPEQKWAEEESMLRPIAESFNIL
jgi:PsbP